MRKNRFWNPLSSRFFSCYNNTIPKIRLGFIYRAIKLEFDYVAVKIKIQSNVLKLVLSLSKSRQRPTDHTGRSVKYDLYISYVKCMVINIPYYMPHIKGQVPLPYFSIFFDCKTVWNEHTSSVFIPVWDFFAMFWNIFCSVRQKKLRSRWCQHDAILATFKIVICAKDKVCWRSQKIVS